MQKFFILFFIIFTVAVYSQENKIPSISVTGRGEIKVEPDIVVFHLVSQTKDKILEKAKTENDKLTAEIISVIKKYAESEKDIQTGRLTIEPRFEKSYEEKGFVGYFVSKDIIFELKNLKKFEELLSELVSKGADRIQGIYFKYSKEREAQSQARIEAVKDARKKATEIAKELGQSIGKAIRVNENTIFQPQPVNLRMQAFAAESSSQGSTFEPGQIKINAEVFCEFELK